jgi:hypothetical protein
MGMEPWLKYIMAKDYTPESDPMVASDKLIADCRARGIVTERLYGEKELAVGANGKGVVAVPPASVSPPEPVLAH